MKTSAARLILLAMVVCAPLRASGQWVKLNSTRIVRPQLSVGSLSLTATPASVNMTLVPKGQTLPSTVISINNFLTLSVLGTFSLWASFSSTSALASTAGDVIPSSAVLGKCNTTGSYAPFTQTGPLSTGSALLIYQSTSLATLLVNTTQTCTLVIDLTSLPQLPAGSYSGTLQIQALAF